MKELLAIYTEIKERVMTLGTLGGLTLIGIALGMFFATKIGLIILLMAFAEVIITWIVYAICVSLFLWGVFKVWNKDR